MAKFILEDTATSLKGEQRGTWVALLVEHMPLAQVMIPGSWN